MTEEAINGLRLFIKGVVAEALDERRKEGADDPILDTKQAAARLGIGTTKFRDLVNAGLIPRIKGISYIRVRQSAVDVYGK